MPRIIEADFLPPPVTEAECETKNGMLDRIDVEIGPSSALTTEQRAKLMEVAAKRPVHPSGSLGESAEAKGQSQTAQTNK